jgi:serine/threonine-protein kinase
MVAQVGKQAPRPSSRNPGISPELDAIVLTALAKKPEDRFSSAKDFGVALAALNGPVKVVRQPTAPMEKMPEAAAPRFLVQAEAGGTQRTAIVLASVCAAIGLIVLFFVLMR